AAVLLKMLDDPLVEVGDVLADPAGATCGRHGATLGERAELAAGLPDGPADGGADAGAAVRDGSATTERWASGQRSGSRTAITDDAACCRPASGADGTRAPIGPNWMRMFRPAKAYGASALPGATPDFQASAVFRSAADRYWVIRSG